MTIRLTTAQVVNEHVDAMIRRDGGPLTELEIWHKNGAHGFASYEPAKAARVQRECENAGARVIARQVR